MNIFSDILRKARREIDRHGLRETARRIGITHSTLLRVVRKDNQGSQDTWTKMMRYYQ